MAMLISKFHRLIQSKMVWYIILVIIVIAFVGLYIQWPADEERAAAANSAGMINGEHVPNQEFQQAYANTYLAVALAAGGRLNLTGEMSDRLKDAAWRRLITLRKAGELSLTATDNEVRLAIAGNPGFAENGQFSPQRYMAFAEQFLRQELGISGARFEEHVREEIILQKLQRMVNQSVLISPYELQRTFSTLIDTFDLEYAMITTNDVKKSTRLTRKELETFFEQDPKAFTLPAKVKVKYVEFPMADHLADFSFSDDEVAEYYEDHLDDYTATVTTTNKVPLLIAAAEGEESFEDQVQEEQVITPLEEVQDEILAKLIREAALNKALDEATDFVVALAPNRQGKSVKFEAHAQKGKKDVLTLEPFTLNDELEALKVGSDFNEVAFSLRPNPDEYFSDAIAGEDTVYVLALEERIPARVPEFSEVEDEVREIATAVAKKEALDELVEDIRSRAEAAIGEGNTFASVITASGLELQMATNVSAMTGIEDEQFADYSDFILRAAIVSNPGEISEPIETEEGFIICHIASRTPGESSSFESYRPNLVSALRQDRLTVNFGAFQQWLVTEAGFKPRSVGEWDDEDLDEEAEEYADEELYEEDLPEAADEDEAE